jgi:HEAT repeat protein
MPEYDWLPFLKKVSADTLDSSTRERLPDDVVRSGWLGFPGASEEKIVALEARLGTKLPPSYRSFLAATDGWHRIGGFIYRLWSCDEVAWFPERHQEDWITPWIEGATESSGKPIPLLPEDDVPNEQYFIYGEEQNASHIRLRYMETALEVSDVGDSAILLLNPKVVFPDGEWEAWSFASWRAGANRYRSFWELMHEEHDGFLRLERKYRPDVSVQEALAMVDAAEEKTRLKGLQLLGEISDHSVVPRLLEIFRKQSGENWTIRVAAIGAACNMNAPQALDAIAVELPQILADEKSGVKDRSGRSPLTHEMANAACAFDDKYEEFLLSLTEVADAGVRDWAVHYLGGFWNEERALRKVIELLATGDDGERLAAAKVTVGCLTPAVIAPLINAIDDQTAEVRYWAVKALGMHEAVDAIGALKARLRIEDDEELREFLQSTIAGLDKVYEEHGLGYSKYA